MRTLVFKFAQVDSVLSADGRRPVRRSTVYRTDGEIMVKVAWNAFERILLTSPFCEVVMPQFVIEREIPGAGNLSDAELQAVAKKSVGVLKEMGPEIKWLHSYVTGDKIYCVYLAPDEETVREHARRGGFPANRVSAVRRLIDPGTAD